MTKLGVSFDLREENMEDFIRTGMLACVTCGGTGINPGYMEVNKLINAIYKLAAEKFQAKRRQKSVAPYCTACLGKGKVDWIEYANKKYEEEMMTIVKDRRRSSATKDLFLFLEYIANGEAIRDTERSVNLRYDAFTNRWTDQEDEWDVERDKINLIRWIKRFEADGYLDGLPASPGAYYFKKPVLEKGKGFQINFRTDICWCCHKHFSELKPFGGPGDPYIGDFSGRYVIRTYRFHAFFDKETEMAFSEAEKNFEQHGFQDKFDYMIAKYGNEKAERYFGIAEESSMTRKSYECRDCICMDTEEYFKKKKQW